VVNVNGVGSESVRHLVLSGVSMDLIDGRIVDERLKSTNYLL